MANWRLDMGQLDTSLRYILESVSNSFLVSEEENNKEFSKFVFNQVNFNDGKVSRFCAQTSKREEKKTFQ